MSRRLILILLIRPRDQAIDATFWQRVQNVLQKSTLPEVAREISSTVNGSIAIPVYSSPYTPQSTQLPLVGQVDHTETTHELLVLFLEVSLPGEEAVVAKLLDELLQGLGGANDSSGITSVDCRVYQPYENVISEDSLRPTREGTLIINCMTPSAESEASFNRWYAEEHIPMLKAVPGWRSSGRFVLVDSKYSSAAEGTQSVEPPPKYLTFHEWVDDGIFQTEEYRAAVNTPWRTQVIGSIQAKQRFVVKYVASLEELDIGE